MSLLGGRRYKLWSCLPRKCCSSSAKPATSVMRPEGGGPATSSSSKRSKFCHSLPWGMAAGILLLVLGNLFIYSQVPTINLKGATLRAQGCAWLLGVVNGSSCQSTTTWAVPRLLVPEGAKKAMLNTPVQLAWPRLLNSSMWSLGPAFPAVQVNWCISQRFADCVLESGFTPGHPKWMSLLLLQQHILLASLDLLGRVELPAAALPAAAAAAVAPCTFSSSPGQITMAASTQCSLSLTQLHAAPALPHLTIPLPPAPSSLPVWLSPIGLFGPNNQVKTVRHAAALALAARRRGANAHVKAAPIAPHYSAASSPWSRRNTPAGDMFSSAGEPQLVRPADAAAWKAAPLERAVWLTSNETAGPCALSPGLAPPLPRCKATLREAAGASITSRRYLAAAGLGQAVGATVFTAQCALLDCPATIVRLLAAGWSVWSADAYDMCIESQGRWSAEQCLQLGPLRAADITRPAPMVHLATAGTVRAPLSWRHACLALQLRLEDALWSGAAPASPPALLDMKADTALYGGLGTRRRPPPWFDVWSPRGPYTVQDLLLAAADVAGDLPVLVLAPVPGVLREFLRRFPQHRGQFLDINMIMPGVWDEVQGSPACGGAPGHPLCSTAMRAWTEMSMAATCAAFIPSRQTTIADTVVNMRAGQFTQWQLIQAAEDLGIPPGLSSLPSLLQASNV